MATKAEIKKWHKEILTSIIQPHGFKLGIEKKYNGAYGIYKQTDIDFAFLLIDIYSDKTVQLGIFDVIIFPLVNKLHEIIKEEDILLSTTFQLPETNAYYGCFETKYEAYKNRKPIESKEQLQKYLQPLIDKFPANIKLIEHYKSIPNLLSKWDEVWVEAEDSSNYDVLGKYFPSPFNRHFIFFLSKIVDYKKNDEIYNKSVNYFKAKVEQYKEKNIRLSGEFHNLLENLQKLKTYFNNLSPEDLEKLKQEFAPFLQKPEV